MTWRSRDTLRTFTPGSRAAIWGSEEDLSDQRFWRLEVPGVPPGGYGPLNALARHKVTTTRIITHWADMQRVAASLAMGTVRAYDLLRMLGRDGSPTPLGQALADYGKLAKTLHLLAMCDPDESYRHTVHVLGALGLVLNAVTLWNTRYSDAAVTQLRAQGYPVDDADAARLSPLLDRHVNVLGRYTFTQPAATGLRPRGSGHCAAIDAGSTRALRQAGPGR